AGLVLALVCAGMCIVLWAPPKPRFQGRTVGEWFDRCALSVRDDGTVEDAAAVDAVLHFGERAAPYLAHALRQRRAAIAEDWNRARSQLPDAATNLVPRRLGTREAWRRTWAAHEILVVAPPELKRAVAKAAVPHLLEEVRNPGAEDRSYRLSFMQVLNPDPALVIPDLNVLVADPDSNVRQAACGFLRRYGRAAYPAMDNLLQLLTNRTPNTVYARQFAIETLGGIGVEAKSAVPVLLPFLRHSNTNLCLAASNALARISPAALAPGGPGRRSSLQ
ncbi:MAG: HEAT repeat domain-containing protein, partial [Verrucomicrobia bacterium]|nr:HEAT repeat domain-containing protein [Verrucomicrobiota bacterium]